MQKSLNTISTYIVAMETTTIQISKDLQEALKERKIYEKESYEEVIWDLLEDTMELSEEVKKDLEKAEEDYKAGRVVSFEEVKKKAGL